MDILAVSDDRIEMSRIFLVGFMGVGKSTVGKILASKLHYNFIDLDNLFEQTYKINIHRFFEKYGEALFRELEYRLLISTFIQENLVVSTGGGTPCFGDAMDQMNRHGQTVFLDMSEETIVHRLSNAKRKRPLVTGKKTSELNSFVHSKLQERLPFYEKSTIRINAVDLNISDLIDQIEKKAE